jgi:DNA-binding protein HU-beta
MTTKEDGTKPLTKSEITAQLAEQVGITRKQVTQFLEAQANLAYKNARNSFVIPGIGKLVCYDRPARMGRHPRTKEPIEIKAKQVLKFRVAKAAKDAILGVPAKQ